MKNILIIVPNDVLGGAEQYLKKLAIYFNEKHYHVDVFFLKDKVSDGWSDLEQFGVKLYYTKNKREITGIYGLVRNLLQFRKTSYDYLFTSHLHINAYANLLRKMGVLKTDKHIARESTSVFLRFQGLKLFTYKTLYSFFYNNIDLLICQSDVMYKQLVDSVPKLKKITKVIPNLISLDNLAPEPYVIEDTQYIVSAGRLIKEKGFDLLIEAFSIVLKTYPTRKLIILGEGEQRMVLENQINKLDLDGKVILKGFVEDVYPYFRGAEVCVVSSRIEGFPNVLLQMMSQNNKVVSTLCAGGIEDLIGVVTCKSDDVDELVKALNKGLELNSDEEIRLIFDEELKKRSIDSFVSHVFSYFKESC